ASVSLRRRQSLAPGRGARRDPPRPPSPPGHPPPTPRLYARGCAPSTGVAVGSPQVLRRPPLTGAAHDGDGTHVLHRRAVVQGARRNASVPPSRVAHKFDAGWHTSCLLPCGMAKPNLT